MNLNAIRDVPEGNIMLINEPEGYKRQISKDNQNERNETSM